MEKTKQPVNKTLRLTETAIMIAAASVLSLIKIVDMPFGGSVTLFSMLPIAVISFRYGIPWGLLTGFANALIQMLFGMKNVSYGTSAAAVIAIIMLDYIVAFIVIGLAGMFRNKIKDSGTALAAGTLITCALRYVCHVISGCTVWAGVSIPDTDGLLFSLAYNATYMIPETIVTVLGAFFAASIFTLRSEQIKRIPLKEKSAATLFTALPVSLGIVVIFALLCGRMQSESGGFDITQITQLEVFDWLTYGMIAIIAVIASVGIHWALSNKANEQA